MMRIVKINVTYEYEIAIDEDDEIVKEYESENLLLVDCASYNFNSILPVIAKGGVKVLDVDLIEVSNQ